MLTHLPWCALVCSGWVRTYQVTGTPIQNNLNEYFALCDFCIPGCLGAPKDFEKTYGKRIQKAQDLDATDRDVELGRVAAKQLSSLVNKIMLRRTNEVPSRSPSPLAGVRSRARPEPDPGHRPIPSCQARRHLLLQAYRAAAGDVRHCSCAKLKITA